MVEEQDRLNLGVELLALYLNRPGENPSVDLIQIVCGPSVFVRDTLVPRRSIISDHCAGFTVKTINHTAQI